MIKFCKPDGNYYGFSCKLFFDADLYELGGVVTTCERLFTDLSKFYLTFSFLMNTFIWLH